MAEDRRSLVANRPQPGRLRPGVGASTETTEGTSSLNSTCTSCSLASKPLNASECAFAAAAARTLEGHSVPICPGSGQGRSSGKSRKIVRVEKIRIPALSVMPP
jgi:hypothetical protein